MKTSCKFFSIILLLFFSGSSLVFSQADFWSDLPDEVLLERLISEMTDEQMLAQMMLLGYMGGYPSPEIIDWIREKEIGGIKIFGWNAGNLKSLTSSISEMQSQSQATEKKIPLFIVTDQEGGWVRHVRGETSETAGNMALGASRIPSDSFKTGYYIGMELRALGINMNFAPTVDVYTNPEAHVIGPRAFSDDPHLTALLSTSYYKGMDSAGIICTAKHFPGHGDADKDSHGALPVINADFETLWERELLPYRYLVKEDIPAIMSGHLAFPKITEEEIPASLSPVFLTEILRDRMGYKGLIVTDDLMMNGVQLLPMNTAEICKAAIDAGNDVILVSRTPEVHVEVWNYLTQLLKTDPDFKKRVRNSAKRILYTKIKYLRREDPVPLFPKSAEYSLEMSTDESSNFFLDQAFRSATIVRSEGEAGLVPFGKILLAGQLDRFFTEGERNFPGADSFKFDYSPFYSSSGTVINNLKRIAEKYDTIIYCLANPNSLQVLESLRDIKTNIIVFSVLTPVYLDKLDWIKNALAVYGVSIESFQAGFGVLRGKITPQGVLPLNFNKENN